METDFASQNPSKEKVDLASPNQPLMEEKNNQKQEKEKIEKTQEKEKKEKPKILLTSTCLNIQSTEKVLKKWSKDKENIKKLQTFLKKYNYLNGRIDGAFGAITHSALQNFQQDNKLYSDGIFGKGTAKWVDKNCRYIQKKKEKEKKEKKELDFAEQNPAEEPTKPKTDIEQKETILNQKIKEIKKEIEKRNNNLKEINQEINQYFKKRLLKTEGIVESNTFALTYGIVKIGEGLNYLKEKSKNGIDNLKIVWNEFWKGDEEKEFFFKIHNNTASKEKHNPNKETIIIIHGFQSEPTDWVEEIASAYDNENREILLLNWKEVVKAQKYSSAVNSVSEVAVKLKEILKEWNIEKEKTTIIGHSLGTILSGELSQNLGGVKKIIALDPAIKTGRKNNFFQNKADETICISTWGSDLSNEKFLNYCDQSYLIKSQYFKTPVLAKHSLAHDIYRQILSKNTLYNNIISFNRPTQHTKQNAEVEDDEIIKIDGFLNAENFKSSDLRYLEMKKGDNIDIYLGTKIDNKFSCNNLVCEFAGWYGKDKYKQGIFDSNKSLIIIKDFNIYSNDKLFIPKAPNEKDIRYSKETNTTSFNIGEMSYVLRGVGEDSVREWVDIATGEYRNTQEGKKISEKKWKKKQEENPIQIK